MSRGAKIGCAVAVAIFVMCAGVCTGLFFFGKSWVEGMIQEMDEAGPEMEADAARIAAEAGPDGCVAEGMKRTVACGPLAVTCQVKATLLTNLCLTEANPPASFCDGVPAQTQFIDAANWAIAECAEAGYPNNDQCTQFMTRSVSKFCEAHGTP